MAYTWDGLIASIGGHLGLALGCSMLSIVQLLGFTCEWCFGWLFCDKNEEEKEDDEDEESGEEETKN